MRYIEMTETIKDYYNRIIGYIDTKPNGDKIGFDFYRRIVGYYEKTPNLTKDFYRRVIGHGDLLVSLIIQANGDRQE